MSLNQIDRHRRRLFIEGLRAVASFYEQNADAYYDGMQITFNMYGVARHTLCEMARVFGQRKKSYDDRNVTVSRQLNEQITLSVSVPRARVCRRMVNGTPILPARIVLATKEVLIPAARSEFVESQCDPLLPDDLRISCTMH
jgi:hypothetical protein